MARYDREHDRDRIYRENRSYARDIEDRRGRYDRDYNRSGGTMFNRDYDRYYGHTPEPGPFHGRTEYERGRGEEPYRSERYYGPDYGRRSHGYEQTHRGAEDQWVLPRVHHTGERPTRYDERRDDEYRHGEREGRWSRPRSFRPEEHEEGYERSRYYDRGRHMGRPDESEDWLEGSRGRIEYDDPYGYRNKPVGPHAGKGPQNYERSPEHIVEEVSERLTQHGGIDASDISVSIENNEIILTGTVESRLTKRLAEDIADSVPGVRDVHNRLTLRRNEPVTPESSTTSAQATRTPRSGKT